MIAHGVSTMPGARPGWNVSQHVIRFIDDQPLAMHPLEIAWAATGPVVVNDDGTGAQPKPAIFVANGATQEKARPGGGSATDTRIALVGGRAPRARRQPVHLDQSSGDFTMTVGLLAAPAGARVVKVEMTPDGANSADGVTLSESDPIADIGVFLVLSTLNSAPAAA